MERRGIISRRRDHPGLMMCPDALFALRLALFRLHDDGTSVGVAIVHLLSPPDTITFHPSIE
jgi:hypothetical protein